MTLPYRTTFFLTNLAGGVAVLGSYVYGFTVLPETAPALWGGVPEAVRPLYTANMFLAAAGYLTAFAYLLLRVKPDETTAGGVPLFERINWLYGALLFGAALWMPLSFAMVAAPDTALWWCIRAVLLLTGGGALCVLAVFLKSRPGGGRGTFYWLSVAGLVAFCLQTAVLDALIWPAYFPR